MSKVRCANSRGGTRLVNPEFSAEGDCQTVYVADDVSGSRGIRAISCDLRDARIQLAHQKQKGELDQLIECLDVGLGHFGSENNKVSPMGVVAVGAEPLPNREDALRCSRTQLSSDGPH